MHKPIRRLVPIGFALLLLAATAPGAAAAHRRSFPTQSLGNRGADVRAIQGLLRARGFPVADRWRSSGTTTDDAGQGLPGRERPDRQRDRRRRRPGRSSSSGWGRASTGEAVKVVQRQLNDKRRAGPGGRRRLRHGDAERGHHLPEAHRDDAARQGRAGDLAPDPVALRLPVVQDRACATTASATGQANWGTGAAIGQLEAAATAFLATGARSSRRSATSAASTAGTSPGHQTHEVGLDVDIRPIRDNENQCTWGTNWRVRVLRPDARRGRSSRRSGRPRRATSSSSTSTTRCSSGRA